MSSSSVNTEADGYVNPQANMDENPSKFLDNYLEIFSSIVLKLSSLEPKLKDISNELAPIKLKWKELGRELGIAEEQFEVFTRTFTSPAVLLCEVLYFWLSGNTSVRPT